MRYIIEPKDRIYVKGYGFLSFVKSMDTYVTKVAKNLSNKYNQKLLDTAKAKTSTTDAIKTASKRAIQKKAEATGDLIGNKIAHKMTDISKISSIELHSQNNKANDEIKIPERKIYISSKKTTNY